MYDSYLVLSLLVFLLIVCFPSLSMAAAAVRIIFQSLHFFVNTDRSPPKIIKVLVYATIAYLFALCNGPFSTIVWSIISTDNGTTRLARKIPIMSHNPNQKNINVGSL